VFYVTADMQTAYFPASWTDVGEVDPFVELSKGRSMGRVEDLLRLVRLVRDFQVESVNEIKPTV
jgi:hypothetical protein